MLRYLQQFINKFQLMAYKWDAKKRNLQPTTSGNVYNKNEIIIS